MTLKKQFRYTMILPMLTALAVCLFLGKCYLHHLHHQEQLQLFLFDSDYALEIMAIPGGLCDYIGRFFTQFFLFAWIGASIMGVLMGTIQALVSRFTGNGWLGCLSPLPILLLTRTFCHENTLVGCLVSILLVLLVSWGMTSIIRSKVSRILSFIILPILYWCAGPVALLFVLLYVIAEVKQKQTLGTWGCVAALLVETLALPAFYSHFVPYEPELFYTGIHYFRSADNDSLSLWLSLFTMALMALLAACFPKLTQPIKYWKEAIAIATIAIAGCWGIVIPQVNSKAENVMAYNFMVRMQQWNRIQQTALLSPPRNSVCATIHNLALAKTGRLADHMFEYPQHGTEGLLPHFESDAMSPLATAEVYYHLGMILTAQYHFFEAQEAILDYQKSAYCYKRLAETNLINGNYKVAGKYLSSLEKTLFYRDWAKQTMSLLNNEEAINNHPEYGHLRQMRCTTDRFYSEYELPQMLNALLLSNRQNKLAFEYLTATCLLQKDLDLFVECLNENQEIAYQTLPVHFQQALLIWWSRNNADLESCPWGISPNVREAMKTFMKDAQLHHNSDLLEKRHGKTYWWYFLRN